MRIALGLAAPVMAALTASPAVAALGPKYQRLAELRAVLAHPGVIGASEPTRRSTGSNMSAWTCTG